MNFLRSALLLIERNYPTANRRGCGSLSGAGLAEQQGEKSPGDPKDTARTNEFLREYVLPQMPRNSHMQGLWPIRPRTMNERHGAVDRKSKKISLTHPRKAALAHPPMASLAKVTGAD